MTGKEGALAALTSHTGLLKYNVYVTYTLVYTYRAESCYPQTLKIPMCVVETPCCRYGCICGPYSPHAVDMGFVVGPVPYAATRMELLGVILDTQEMTIALPEQKMSELRQVLQNLYGRRKCTQRELLSVVGRLVHASKCVPPGRAFTRRLLDAAHSVSGLERRVRVTAGVRADLRWWDTFLPLWNGTFPLVPPPGEQYAHIVLNTDSSRWGMGAWCGSEWWMSEWPEQIQQDVTPSMTWLELVPVMIACLVWGGGWAGQRVRIFSDNMGVVGVWGRGWSGDGRIMALIRQLLFVTARQQFVLDVAYVGTKENGAADALSRNDTARFRRLRPYAADRPTVVPECLPDYLSDPIHKAHLLTGCRL